MRKNWVRLIIVKYLYSHFRRVNRSRNKALAAPFYGRHNVGPRTPDCGIVGMASQHAEIVSAIVTGFGHF